MKKVIVLWSGGKDSCLACYKAKLEGYHILTLLNLVSFDGGHSLSHGLSAQLIKRQAQAVDMPFLQKSIVRTEYRKAFMELMEDFKRKSGIEGIVFGDIYLEEHRDWIDKVCAELRVEAILPIWGLDTTQLLAEIIGVGFKSIVVSVKNSVLGEEWLGRQLDLEFIRDLKAAGDIDPCGERGEFHTFVYDGPLFRRPVKFKRGRKILRGGYWFLKIT